MAQEPTLAQRVRAKYPGAYDDLDDAALESAFVAKYPGAYDDLPRTASAVPRGAPPVAPASPAEEAPSLAGFGRNVVSSAGRFVSGIASPVLHPVETVKGILALASRPDEAGRMLKDAIVQRYGSLDAIRDTAYTDPVGMASDLSIVLGGVAKAAQAAGYARAARTLSTSSAALNPLTVPAKAAATGGRAVYGAAINPSRRIRRGFPGAIDEGYKRNVLPTERGLEKAETALEASATHTAARLTEAERLGAPGVNISQQIAPAFREPITKAMRRTALGLSDERPALADRARRMSAPSRTPAGNFASRRRDVPLTEANIIKREAQSLADAAFRAQERGAIIKDLDALANKNVAQAYRRAIERNAAAVGVTDIAQSNRRTQSLIGLAQALEDATQQPSRLTHLMATLGATGGAMAGGVPGAAAAYVGGRIATAKPVMAATGIAVGKGGAAALRQAQILRALAVLRAADPSGSAVEPVDDAGAR